MKHVKAPAIPATVVIVSQYGGEDYYNETKRGYSEDAAFYDILQGQVEDVQQVLKITVDTCEDISAFIAARIIRRIDAGDNVALSAVDFATEHGGYEPPRQPKTYFDLIDDEQQRRRA